MDSSALAAGIRHFCDRLAVSRRHAESDEQLLHAFADRHDEDAFAVLVRRYSSMVLHVCRRVLGCEQDAEDAFQATFLILARNVASLRKKTALAGFLHGTAYRIARTAQRSAVRRRKHEGRAPTRSPVDPADELLRREMQTLLDEEIDRLPEKYRSVFVLCGLENLSRAEAGRRLGLKERTVLSRLAEARKRLRQRLSHRGVELSALLAAMATTETASALPAVLVTKTIGGAASPAAAALADSVAAIFGVGKAKLALALVMAASVLTGAGLWAGRSAIPAAAVPQSAAKEKGEDRPKPRKPRQEKKQIVDIGGRVVDPDGKPVRGAKLLFLWWGEKLPDKIRATSGVDGRFAFALHRPAVANSGWEMGEEPAYVLAAADGYGFAVTRLDKIDKVANVTLQLVKDDVPIRGRVLNREGKPIAGVRVGISNWAMFSLNVPKKNDLTDWLAALKTSKENPWNVQTAYLTRLHSSAFDLLIPPVKTGADGRFVMRGIGRERLAHLRIEGPTIATQIVNAMTRPGEKIRLPLSWSYPKGETITYYGAAFEVRTEPTKPVVGVVRDRDTGKPLAGVTITPNKITNPWNISNHNAWLIRTTTDKDGGYRLVGLPKGDDNQLLATTKDLPYLPVTRKVPNTPGLEAVAVDFALKRGVWVKGRVTEKTTGKPLWADVEYFCFRDNAHAKEIPFLQPKQFLVQFGGGLGTPTSEDGSFRLVAAPGRGLIAVVAYHNDRYLSGAGVDKIETPRGRIGDLEYLKTYPIRCFFDMYNAVVEIAPKDGDESITCNLSVVPGRSLTGTVLGPDGKPLAGARRRGWDTPLSGSEFTVRGLNPDKPKRRVLEFVHDDKKLAGFVVIRGDEKEPPRVRLEPWGAFTGRLVTPRGEPLSGVAVSCTTVIHDFYPDKKGRFRIEGLTPGWKYKLYVSKEGLVLPFVGGERKNLTVKPGETKDVGVLKVKVGE